uniref:protein-histidine N-methyltransferase n=1 Tax=Cacopsylla melanoneura TaxID=428564 RepID=A0A8D9EQH8_9HEMI
MFKFNFNNDTENTDDVIESPVVESKEFTVNTDVLLKIKLKLGESESKINISTVSDIKLIHTPLFEYESITNIAHTDLKPNVYEGGYKIWECTFDLLNFVRNNVDICAKRVLDLGCGAGLLGLYTLLNDAAHVSFQDYNQEVVESLTLPNILLNTQDLSKCKLYHGDWSSLTEVIDTKFDIILTSETIYSVTNHNKLISVFKNLLNSTGCVYLAAKIYYFGVGGCIYDFEKLLVEHDFETTTVWEQNEGVKRKIIKIQFKISS